MQTCNGMCSTWSNTRDIRHGFEKTTVNTGRVHCRCCCCENNHPQERSHKAPWPLLHPKNKAKCPHLDQKSIQVAHSCRSCVGGRQCKGHFGRCCLVMKPHLNGCTQRAQLVYGWISLPNGPLPKGIAEIHAVSLWLGVSIGPAQVSIGMLSLDVEKKHEKRPLRAVGRDGWAASAGNNHLRAVREIGSEAPWAESTWVGLTYILSEANFQDKYP